MVRPTLRTSGATPSNPRSPRESVSHCAVASIASTVTPNCGASVSRMNTTAQPARALKSRAVGLGASLVPPSGAGRSVCQENEPCSITALLPSDRAITVGFPLALSGSARQRRTVSSMRSRFMRLPTFLHRYAPLLLDQMLGAANLILETSILGTIFKQTPDLMTCRSILKARWP